MDRHLTPENVRELSESQRELILSEQAESLRHAQEQGQKFFRILIAASALVFGLAGTQIYSSIVNNEDLYQLLSSDLVFKEGFVETAPAIVSGSLSVAVTLGVITAGLLFEAAITSIQIMKIDGTLPVAKRKDTRLESEQEREGDLLSKWILENEKRVTEAFIYLNRCFTLIWLAISIGFLTMFLVAMTAIGWLPMMALAHLIVLLLVPIGVTYYGRQPVKTIWNADAESLRDRAEEAFDQWFDSWEYTGPSAGMKIVLFLILSTTWGKSISVLNYWLQSP